MVGVTSAQKSRYIGSDISALACVSACSGRYVGSEIALHRFRNQRCGGLAPRVGVERVQLFVGVGASSWCNFFSAVVAAPTTSARVFFLAVFSGARRWWVLLLVVVLVGWL